MGKVSVTAGIGNTLRKLRPREVCTDCGLTIPVYPGRYPRLCPNCGGVFRRVEERIRHPIHTAIDFLLEEVEVEPPGEPDTATKLGRLVDQVIQRINVQGLLDYFVGVEYSPERGEAWFFFSEHPDYATLEQFTSSIRGVGVGATLERVDRDDASWVVTVASMRPGWVREKPGELEEEPPEVEISGELKVAKESE